MEAFGQAAYDVSQTEPFRVLVIDDDPSVSTAIQAILSRRNGETEIASRAHAGIHALASSHFDVVMIDIFMPGLNGLDTITHIRRGRTIPIIAMSGFRLRGLSGSDDYLDMAMQRGATGWLRKPFSPQQLFESIEKSLCCANAYARDPIQ
jgi:CheY-like chemotaxis protein